MANERRMQVLRAIVSDYVETREPVGSKSLVERHKLGVSPATIRNDMACLEEEGYIIQPHTSAGRIPTDKGYRLFVDQIDQLKPLSAAEKRAISQFFAQAVDLDDVMECAVRLLAQLTGQTAVVEIPALHTSELRHLEVVPLSNRKVLLVIISQNGRVDQRFGEFATDFSAEEVSDLASELRRFCLGKTQRELCQQTPLWQEDGYDLERKAALEMLFAIVTEAMNADGKDSRIMMSGMANLTRRGVDFARSITPIVEALEEQVVLLKLFSEMVDDSVNVSIGQEIGHDALAETSIVSGTYEIGSSAPAHLGVIGPTRMDYPNSIAMVRAVGRYLSRILNQ